MSDAPPPAPPPSGRPLPGARAARALLLADPVLGPVVRRVGPCALRIPPGREPWEALVHAVAHQQVHGRAAAAMLARLRALRPGAAAPGPGPLPVTWAPGADDYPSPAALLALPPEALRGCGFSGAKVAAIQDIARHAAAGALPSRAACARLSDEALVERLLPIRGVGRWTVEMLLIFTLGRPDVLPVDDFGVREGWRAAAGLDAQPTPKVLRAIGRAWAPHRSTAAWYLWRAADAAKAARPAGARRR